MVWTNRFAANTVNNQSEDHTVLAQADPIYEDRHGFSEDDWDEGESYNDWATIRAANNPNLASSAQSSSTATGTILKPNARHLMTLDTDPNKMDMDMMLRMILTYQAIHPHSSKQLSPITGSSTTGQIL